MSGSASVVEELLAKGAWVDARSQVGLLLATGTSAETQGLYTC